MEDIFVEGHKTGFKPKGENDRAGSDRPSTPSSYPALPQGLGNAGHGGYAAAASPASSVGAPATPPPFRRPKAVTTSPAQQLARQQQAWGPPPAFVPGQRRW